MYSDETGCASWIDYLLKALAGVAIIGSLVMGSIFTGGALSVVLAGAAIGAFVGAVGATVSTTFSGDWSNFGTSFLMGTIVGGISGAIAASPLNIGWQIGRNAVLNVSNYAVTTAISGGNITFGGLLNGNTMASAATASLCKNRSIFSEDEIRKIYKKYPTVVKVLDFVTFKKTVNLSQLRELGIFDYKSGPRPFTLVDDKQFEKIYKLGMGEEL